MIDEILYRHKTKGGSYRIVCISKGAGDCKENMGVIG